MNGAVTSYATVLLTLPNASDAVADAQQTFQNCPLLTDSLSNPTISEAEKFAVIDRIFPESLRTFLRLSAKTVRSTAYWRFFQNIKHWNAGKDIVLMPCWNM